MSEISVMVHVREWLAKTTVPPLRSFSLPPELESTLPKVGEEFSVDASFMGDIRRLARSYFSWVKHIWLLQNMCKTGEERKANILPLDSR
jgi:hypothetical protein